MGILQNETNELAKQDVSEEEFNYDDFDFDAMDDMLEQDFEELTADLDALGEEKELLTNPDSLGKEIYNSIFTQLGAQSGLDLSSDTLIEQYKKNHIGEDSQSAGVAALRDKKYVKAQKANTEASKTSAGIQDAYTGKIVKRSDGHQINTDHVVSRKELYGDGFWKNLRELSGYDVKDLANIDENLVPTNEALNKSKSDKSIKTYIASQEQRNKDHIENNKKANEKIRKNPNLSDEEKAAKIKENNTRLQDKLDADNERMKAQDKKARKAINKKIVKGAAINVTKEAATAALRGVLISSAITLIKNIMDSLIEFWKSNQKSWSLFKEKMKQSLTNFFHSLKSIVGNAKSAGVGSIVNNLMSLFGEIFRKAWGILKSGCVTVINVWKILANKETPLSIRIAEVGKALTVGLAVASTASLSEIIKDFLILKFPSLATAVLPIIGSVPGFITELIIGVLNGVIAGIVINKLNNFIAGKQKSMLVAKTIEKQNEILNKQAVQIALVEKGMEVKKEKTYNEIEARHEEANELTKEILNNISSPIPENNYNFDEMQADLASLL